MYISFLLPYNIRHTKAPFLWVFYKQLSTLQKSEVFYIGNEDYFTNPKNYHDRPELSLSSKNWQNYEVPTERTLANLNKAIIPDSAFDALREEYSSYTQIYNHLLTRRYKPLEIELEKIISNLVEKGNVEAILSWGNMPSLQVVADKHNLKVIYNELGPIRNGTVFSMDLSYLDFSGVNGRTEAKERYENSQLIADALLTHEEILILTVQEDYLPIVLEKVFPSYEVGIILQVEDDSNILAYANGLNSFDLISLVRETFNKEEILIRPHPGGHLQYDNLGTIDDSSTSIEFIKKCTRLVTINSSVALEAILLKKPTYILGESPISFLAYNKFDISLEKSSIVDIKEKLNFILFNYLIPNDFVFMDDYYKFRLSNPKEEKIYQYHINYISAMKKNDIEPSLMMESMIFKKCLNRYHLRNNKNREFMEEQLQDQKKQLQEKEEQIEDKKHRNNELEQQLALKDREVAKLTNSYMQLESLAQSMRIKNRIKKLFNIKQFFMKKEKQLNHNLVKKGVSLKEIEKLCNYQNESHCISNDIIDIVIPVYNGLQHLEPLFESIFNNSDLQYRLIIVNDASPDLKVEPFILQKIKDRKNCFYFKNSRNLGFTKTVNFSLTKVQSKHFVLLNTDVIVPKKWLSRLMAPFYNYEKVASITPFSNSAVFFSYPIMGEDNKLPPGFSVQDIDDAFNLINPKIDKDCEIHSGVGFCMAIDKNCWDEIGEFDADTFGKGYGEENDWCMRAIKYGWKNIVCPNLYVFHNHGGSFPLSEKEALMKANSETLHKRWPLLNSMVEKFVESDPWKKYRLTASLKLSQSSYKCVLVMDLDFNKGGAYAYRKQKMEKYSDDNYKVLLLTHAQNRKEWILSTQYGDIEDKYYLNDINELRNLFKIIKIEKIFINNFVYINQENLQNIFSILKEIKKNYNISYEYVFHDYLSLCSSFFLMDNNNDFCYLPDMKKCNECLKENPNRTVMIRDITTWRELWGGFLENVDKLTVFSNSTKSLVLKVYPQLNLEVKEHSTLVSYSNKYMTPIKKDPLIIGCFGAFSESKGALKIIELAGILKDKYPDAKILIYGHVYMDIVDLPGNIIFMGLYDKNKLPDILIENSITLVFFASIYSETFSYVVQELMLAEAPIVCFDIGAPAERIKRESYQPSCTAPEISAYSAMECIEKLYNKLYA